MLRKFKRYKVYHIQSVKFWLGLRKKLMDKFRKYLHKKNTNIIFRIKYTAINARHSRKFIKFLW